jgi:hypothetical protein
MNVAQATWCPSVEQLADFVRHVSPGREAQFIREHLNEGCAACRGHVSRLQEMWSLVDGWMIRDAPDWLMREAVAMFDRQRDTSRHQSDHHAVALLVADSFGRDMLLGFRSTRKMSRQLLYHAGDYDIDLCIHFSEREPCVLITGQANPMDGNLESVAGGEVELYRETDVVARTIANEFGWFYLDDSPEGIYDLLIRLKSGDVEIQGLNTIDPIN